MKTATVLSFAIGMIWLQIICTGCHDGTPDANGSSPSNGIDVVEVLRQHGKQIVEAKDAEAEADAIKSLSAWVKHYERAHTTRQYGPTFSMALIVREQQSRENVTYHIDGSNGPVEAEMTFYRDNNGTYKEIYKICFVPKQKGNLEFLMQE